MDENLLNSIRERIRALRGRRDSETTVVLVEVRNRFSSAGALGQGRYQVDLDSAAGRELERRTDLWISTVKTLFLELDIPWTPSASEAIQTLLGQELQKDGEELRTRLESMGRRPGANLHSVELTKVLDQAPGMIRSDLDLQVYREAKHRTPLIEQLASPRYRAVRVSWKKACDFNTGATPDPANAAKEAVSAVEQLARLVVRKPKATLGDAIKDLRRDSKVPAPLLKGFEELWGWTSTEDGVRHGAADSSGVDPSASRYVVRQSEAALLFLLELDTV